MGKKTFAQLACFTAGKYEFITSQIIQFLSFVVEYKFGHCNFVTQYFQ